MHITSAVVAVNFVFCLKLLMAYNTILVDLAGLGFCYFEYFVINAEIVLVLVDKEFCSRG